jgi:hypothetical protein
MALIDDMVRQVPPSSLSIEDAKKRTLDVLETMALSKPVCCSFLYENQIYIDTTNCNFTGFVEPWNQESCNAVSQTGISMALGNESNTSGFGRRHLIINHTPTQIPSTPDGPTRLCHLPLLQPRQNGIPGRRSSSSSIACLRSLHSAYGASS